MVSLKSLNKNCFWGLFHLPSYQVQIRCYIKKLSTINNQLAASQTFYEFHDVFGLMMFSPLYKYGLRFTFMK